MFILSVFSCRSWRTKPGISQICAIICFILFVVIVSLSMIFFTRESVCSSSECKRATEAASVFKRIDLSVDPCDDFYRFACGKFLNTTEIPSGQSNVNPISEINDKVQKQLQSLLNETFNANDPAFFNVAKKLYKHCTSKPFDEHMKELIYDITANFGVWPTVEISWLIDPNHRLQTRHWTNLNKEFRRLGYDTNSILSLGVDVDHRNSSSHIIYLSQPEFGVNREYLLEGLDNNLVKSYYKLTLHLTQQFITGTNSRVETELKKTLEFEIQLAKISQPIEKQRNSSTLYNPLTLRKLHEKYPYINWVDYVNALFPSPLSVDENEIVVDVTPSYFEGLRELLEKTPAHVIRNYMIQRAIMSQAKLMSMEAASGKNCIDSISKNLPYVVSAMYVRNHFHDNSIKAVTKMVKEIAHEFRRILEESYWLDEKTRGKALQKLDSMSLHIGYPDWLMNDSEVEQLHKNSEINENSYVASLLSITKFATDYQFSKLRTPVEKNDWNMQMPPFTVNAANFLNKNGLQLPAASLQLFSFERPWYMNFGTIGSIIGHEIAHGFDDQGAQYDSEGQLFDWWEPKMKQNFVNRTKCIIEQYGNYTEPMTSRKVNGVVTQGENIADNAGFKVSYLAYQQWEKSNGIEPKLPLLNYTSQQMFWISAAQLYCSVFTGDDMSGLITDEHSPNQFRILGSFSNNAEFVKDFNCPEGSPMNRSNKCIVW